MHSLRCCPTFLMFHDLSTDNFSITQNIVWKLPIFTKSMEINLSLLKKYTSKTLDAQLHMLPNIPVKFHNYGSNTWSAPITQVENCNFFTTERIHRRNYTFWPKFLFTSFTFGAMRWTTFMVQCFTISSKITYYRINLPTKPHLHNYTCWPIFL